MDLYFVPTKRYVSFKTALQRNLLTNPSNFRLPDNLKIYMTQDKRTKEKVKYLVSTDKREQAGYKRKKNTTLVFPNPIKSLEIDLEDYKNFRNWEYKPFVAPLMLLNQANINKQTVEFQFVSNNTIIDRSKPTKLDNEPNTWWESGGFFEFNQSDYMNNKTKNNIQNADTFRMTYYNDISPNTIVQSFRDGDTHCILQPILDHYTALIEEAKTKKTKENRQTLKNKTLFYMKKYANGIPETELEEVAKALEISIVIQDTTFNELYRVNPKCKGKVFKYTNSRINHCEYVTIDLNRDAECISVEEAQEILNNCKANNLHNYYTGTYNFPKTITTSSNKYRIGDDNGDILYNFNDTFDRGMYINSVKDKELAHFIIKGTNLMINWLNNKSTPTHEIDLKKAYTQFKSAPNYIGFPAIINNVRLTALDHDVKANPGIYQIYIKHLPQSKFLAKISNAVRLLKAYGFQNNKTYILTSPWIIELLKHGVELEVQHGCWGKRMDFDFSKEMIDSKMYQIWTGIQLHTEEDDKFKMMATEEFAEVMMAQSPSANMLYNKESETLMISKPKDRHNILPHISAYIVSYTQLHVFKESLKYEPSEIVGTKLDSIMLTVAPKPFNDLWTVKSDEIKINQATSSYIFNSQLFNSPIFKQKATYTGDYFLSGQGGSGKTQITLTDPGFRKVQFTSIAWKLIAEKINEFNIKGNSLNQLLGLDAYNKPIPSIKVRYGQPGVLVVDEASMISKTKIQTIKDMYPYSQLIIMGDYHKGKYYQTSIDTNADLYHPETYHIIPHDYRSLDDETRSLKLKIREMMDNNEPKMNIINYLINQFDTISKEQLKQEYNMDYVLSGTHERIKTFTELLKGENNHYLILEHKFDEIWKKCSGDKTVFLHGEIIDHYINPQKTKLIHGFTVHSFQGTTIPETKLCYIDLANLRTSQDIYTAVSRVRSIKQIRILGNW